MNLPRNFRLAATVVALSFPSFSVLAAGSLAHADKKFIQDAAVGGMFEVKVSQMAEAKASDPAVKSFAQMLVKDHTAANEELKQVAQQKDVELPAALPKNKQSDIDKLSRKSGEDFDRSYMREVGLNDHRKDIKMFEKESKSGKDEDTKAFATKTLPTLREHLKAAEQLKGPVRAGAIGVSPMPGNASRDMTKS